MANMYISEYAGMNIIQIPEEPPVTTPQKVTFTISVASAAFSDKTQFVGVHLDMDGHITVGTAPTATTNHRKLIAGVDYYFRVKSGDKIAAITA